MTILKSELRLALSDKVMAIGGAAFIRETAVPVADEMDLLSQDYPCNQDDIDMDEAFSGSPQAGLGEISGLVGVSAFLGSWAATKLLDELFDLRIGPLLRSAIKRAFESGAKDQMYALSLAVHNAESRTVVLIVAAGKSMDELECSEGMVRPTLSFAIQQAAALNTEGVHVYLIENGRTELKPSIVPTLASALHALKRMKPASMPKFIRDAGSKNP